MADKDYLAKLTVDPEKDKLDSGVMGMKWGQRRSSAELRTAAAKRSEAKPMASSGQKPTTTSSVHPSSTEHYAKLLAQAKAGKAGQMNEPDLKFFNSRTEALAKVAKLNQSDPGWLSKTSKIVIQKAAQTQLQAITDALANKYISGPVLDNVGKHITKEAAKAAADAAASAG